MSDFLLEISKDEAHDLYWAICVWINHIQTGDVNLSAVDAEQAKAPVKALSIEQMKTVVALDNLRAKILKHQSQYR